MESPNPLPIACTEEAKLCPDGTAVGRVGPTCEFAPCSLPNVEDRDIGIAFVIPEGYTKDVPAIGSDSSLRAVFTKSSLSEGVPHNITIRKFPLQGGETSEERIIQETRFSPSDTEAESIDDFEERIIDGKGFYSVVVERFEAQVVSYYYLPRENDVLRFEVWERDVTDWMEPSLVIEELPEHRAFIRMLETLQSHTL
jgi:hypothetical protein